MISLKNIEDAGPHASLNRLVYFRCINTLIFSPRSLEACKRLGIMPEELRHKPLEEFADGIATLEILNMRYKS